MKKLYTLLLLVVASMSFGQAASSFTGTVGAAVNANGWQTHSGILGQMLLASTSLTYSGLTSTGNKTQLIAGNTEDINLSGFTPQTSGTVYYSGLINLPNTTGLAANTTTGNYFLMTGATAGLSGVSTFNARLYIRAGVAQNTFNLGILNGSNITGAVTPSFSSVDYAIATTYFIVCSFDFATNTASLWVNPAIGSAITPALVTNNTGTTAAPAQIASLCIREAGNATAGTGNIDIDELRIADSWTYVTSGTLRNNQFDIAGLKVYPNPVTNGVVNVATDANGEKTVAIFDVLGKQVLKTTTSNNSLNVANLNAGVYIIKITEEGKTATRKLVIR
jgi:hypothetical protein